MSQVSFKVVHKGKRLNVVGGWDRPLHYFFLTIYNLDAPSDEEIFWSGLDHFPGGGVPTVGEIHKQMYLLGIEMPEGFLERCALKEGNITHTLRGNEWVRTER